MAWRNKQWSNLSHSHQLWMGLAHHMSRRRTQDESGVSLSLALPWNSYSMEENHRLHHLASSWLITNFWKAFPRYHWSNWDELSSISCLFLVEMKCLCHLVTCFSKHSQLITLISSWISLKICNLHHPRLMEPICISVNFPGLDTLKFEEHCGVLISLSLNLYPWRRQTNLWWDPWCLG